MRMCALRHVGITYVRTYVCSIYHNSGNSGVYVSIIRLHRASYLQSLMSYRYIIAGELDHTSGGCFHKLGVLFVDVLTITAPLIQVYTRAPVFWKVVLGCFFLGQPVGGNVRLYP